MVNKFVPINLNVVIIFFFLPSNPLMKADKTKKVWELYCFILRLGLRITFSMDKTIAHTNGYAKSQ